MYFSKVNITPLTLERISSVDAEGGRQESRLTNSRVRKFSISAELAESK